MFKLKDDPGPVIVGLKACPFCGSTPIYLFDIYVSGLKGFDNMIAVECRHCHTRGPDVKIDEEIDMNPAAAEAWNTRA